MKITLSKNQWEQIGIKTGWIKKANLSSKNECSECHGKKSIIKKLKNHGTLEWTEHNITCPTCNGKGYTDKSDSDSYLHNMGVKPCPHNK